MVKILIVFGKPSQVSIYELDNFINVIDEINITPRNRSQGIQECFYLKVLIITVDSKLNWVFN